VLPLPAERRAFLQSTALWAAAGFAALAAFSIAGLKSGASYRLLSALAHHRLAWGLLLIGFVALSFAAARSLQRGESTASRLIGVGLAAGAESWLFAPVLARMRVPLAFAVLAVAVMAMMAALALAWAAWQPARIAPRIDWVASAVGFAALLTVALGLRFGFFNAHPWVIVPLLVLAALALIHHNTQMLRTHPVDCPGAAALNLFALAPLFRMHRKLPPARADAMSNDAM
jgi:hypothetical protein